MNSLKGQVAANCSIAAPTKMPVGVEEKVPATGVEKPRPHADA
jgi:hypothetical protein